MKESKKLAEGLHDLITNSVPDLPSMRRRFPPLHDLVLDGLVKHIRLHFRLPDDVDDVKLRKILEIVSWCVDCHFQQSTSHYPVVVKVVVEALTGAYVEGLVKIQNWNYYKRAGVDICYEWVRKYLEGSLPEEIVNAESCVELIRTLG